MPGGGEMHMEMLHSLWSRYLSFVYLLLFQDKIKNFYPNHVFYLITQVFYP